MNNSPSILELCSILCIFDSVSSKKQQQGKTWAFLFYVSHFAPIPISSLSLASPFSRSHSHNALSYAYRIHILKYISHDVYFLSLFWARYISFSVVFHTFLFWTCSKANDTDERHTLKYITTNIRSLPVNLNYDRSFLIIMNSSCIHMCFASHWCNIIHNKGEAERANR